MVDVCIIPAAGRGSRWAPVSGYLPKEMLPLIDKPVIEWVIGEVLFSGIDNIIVVINKSKEIIKKHLLSNKKLKNKRLTFVYQEEPLGVAHALFLCRKYIGFKPFAVALPDLPVISKVPATKQLLKAHSSTNKNSHFVSFDKFPPEQLGLYSECFIEKHDIGTLKIVHFCSKQKDTFRPHHPGSNIRMSGRFIFMPRIWKIIEEKLKRQIPELTDIDILDEALKRGQSLVGIKISGHTYDTGTPESYVRANTAFFKKEML